MINLKNFKENAAKYFHLCMIEVQPQDVVEIYERAIVAEELAEARRRGAESAVNELTDAHKEIITLTAQLAEIENQKSIGQVEMSLKTADLCAHLNGHGYRSLKVGDKLYAQPAQLSAEQPKLAVWYGPVPESNGKTNWTALLHRADSKGFDMHTDGITLSRSEYSERVLYEADYVRWLIGELPTKPDILAYDADKHSGYVEPVTEIVGHKPKRITEQDAREIALAFVKVRNKYTSAQSSDLFSGWINTGEGSTLLAKLNEHREPDYKVQRDDLLVAINGVLNLPKQSGHSVTPPPKEYRSAEREAYSVLHSAIAKFSGKQMRI